MLVDYIDQHRERFGVEPICTVLRDAGMQIAPSTYYAAKKRPSSARAVRDAKLVVDIKTAHQANLGVYGARKIHAELNREGVTVARCTVEGKSKRDIIRCLKRYVINAMAEALNSLFKAEYIRNPVTRPKGDWKSVVDVEITVAEYIDWFNHRRLHGEIGLVPPAEFEADH